MEYNDIIVDDGSLLADRVLRSLHRNEDGHLAGSAYDHESSIEKRHNVAILQIYTCEDEVYTLHEHYAYSPDPLTYIKWRAIVFREIEQLEKYASKSYHGVYGWSTGTIKIHPLRTGDLFIKIDKEGATGVRLTFNSRKAKHETRKEKKRKAA